MEDTEVHFRPVMLFCLNSGKRQIRTLICAMDPVLHTMRMIFQYVCVTNGFPKSSFHLDLIYFYTVLLADPNSRCLQSSIH